MSTLTSFLQSKYVDIYEGYSQQCFQQVTDLISLTNKPNLNVMEIGFNAGHSAEIFLHNNPSLNLISFDLGVYDCVHVGKQYIDNTYPNRHKLILGDSTLTVPKFINENKDTKFDIIFIDGGHEYEIAKTDITNCYHLAHKDTIVILDDTIFRKDWEKIWNIGPSKNWIEHLEQNKIIELNRHEYYEGKGMSWGKYVF